MTKLRILRWSGGSYEHIDDLVADEAFLHLEVNSTAIDTLITPEQVKEFVYGNLFSEGFISRPEDVLTYSEKRKGSDILVKTTVRDFEKKEVKFRRNYRVIWTDCVTEPMRRRMGERLSRPKPSRKIDAKVLSNVALEVAKGSDLYRTTGAYHYAYLFDLDGNQVTHAWDISRHNTVDKVIGHVLLTGGSFEDRILFTTGRLTSTLVLKALRCGIPVLASKGAPLRTAVEVAREYDLALVGFLRRGRFNVYSGEDHFGGTLKEREHRIP